MHLMHSSFLLDDAEEDVEDTSVDGGSNDRADLDQSLDLQVNLDELVNLQALKTAVRQKK